MSFNLAKKRRKADFEKIRAAFDASAYEVRDRASQRNLQMRLAQSLYAVGRMDVFKRIESCASGKKCGSLWCRSCRDSASRSASERLISRVREKQYSNDDFIHLTAPVGLAKFDLEDVNRVLHEDSLRWKRIRNRNGFWIEAIYEFELVNFRYLMSSDGSDLKKVQMKQLVEASGLHENEFIFVHWHGVSDIRRNDVARIFSEEYFVGLKPLYKTMESGLYVQGFHKDKDVDQNMRKIGSYPFKNALRFKHTFKGSNYSNGEFFTLEELGNLVTLYQEVQGRHWRRLRRHSSQ